MTKYEVSMPEENPAVTAAPSVFIPYRGISCYAGFMPTFPRSAFFEQYPEDIETPAIAFLYDPGNWGDNFQIAWDFQKMFKDRKHLIEVHPMNETAREGRGPKYVTSFLSNLNVIEYQSALGGGVGGGPVQSSTANAIRKRIEEVKKIFGPLTENPNTKLILSTGLECKLNGTATHNLYLVCQQAWPDMEFVRSNMLDHGPVKPDSQYIELHGWNGVDRYTGETIPQPTFGKWVSRGILNMDGFSLNTGSGLMTEGSDEIIPDAVVYALNSDEYYRKAFGFFLWVAPQQGLYGPGAALPFPGERRYQVTQQDIKVVSKILAGAGKKNYDDGAEDDGGDGSTVPDDEGAPRQFRVKVAGVFYANYEVTAKSSAKAIDKVYAGLANQTLQPTGDLELKNVLGTQDWVVEEIP